MTRRAMLITAGLLSGCGQDPPAPEAGPRTPQNLLLITMDTTRADHLGCYGGDARITPNLDALARQGVTCERAYTPVPYTLPAHTTLLTGEPPFVHGVRTNAFYRVPASAVTLAEHLQRVGAYHTAAFPSADVLLATQGLDQGFDEYQDDLGDGYHLAIPMRPAERTTDYAVEWLQTAAEPFFAWVHYFDPHSPYEEPPDLRGQFASPYAAEIHHVDRQLRRILDLLEEQGRRPRTWVCVTADHGESLGEHGEESHGYFLYEATMRVPLIVSHPSLAPGRVGAPIGLQDLAPTLLDGMGLPPLSCTGESRLAALQGTADPQPVYLETYVPFLSFGWSPLEAVVHDSWKFIDAPRPELYHLADDPGEVHNVYATEGDVVARLRALLEELRQADGRLEQEIAELDAEASARLEELGYVATTAPAALARGDLPRPGMAAGPDPKDRRDTLPLVQRLFTAGAQNAGAEIFRVCREILAVDPGNPIPLQYMGTEFARQGRYREALKPLQEMDRSGRITPKALQVLGIALLECNELEAAASALERCLARTPADSTALRWLADLETRRGNPDRARQLYERLLATFRGPLEARAAIEAEIQRLPAPRDEN